MRCFSIILKRCVIKIGNKYLKIGLTEYTSNIEEAQVFYSKSQAKRIISKFRASLKKELKEDMFRKLKIIVEEL
jgi:hypothetical protein